MLIGSHDFVLRGTANLHQVEVSLCFPPKLTPSVSGFGDITINQLAAATSDRLALQEWKLPPVALRQALLHHLKVKLCPAGAASPMVVSFYRSHIWVPVT